jgi:MFS family permease
VLITLAAAQFLMTLDSSVMNVSMATVANDVHTSITGIQTAITLYTLVMATLMITGGKIGSMIGRRRAFAIGCVIYGTGSLVTGLAPNLLTLLIGWSLLEGIGAALIMPAIVALVAANFGPAERPRTYGLIAASGAIACILLCKLPPEIVDGPLLLCILLAQPPELSIIHPSTTADAASRRLTTTSGLICSSISKISWASRSTTTRY